MNSKNLSSNSLSPQNRSKISPQAKRKSPPRIPKEIQSNEGQSSASPLKYLLQNSININQGRQGERSIQEIQVISNLLRDCSIFKDLEIDLTDTSLCKQLCNAIVLIYCQSPHIMEIKQNQIYVFFQGQGFEYMENGYAAQTTKKYKLYENNEYVMLRKIHTNQYFYSLQDAPTRYHANPKKCQLMVDQSTLIGKFSERIFHKIFNLRLKERQANFIATMKKVQIFSGFPNTFFHQLSKFLFEQKAVNGSKVLERGDKCKFVYFLKTGSAQIRYFNQTTGKTLINSTQNYYISNNRPYTCSTLKPFDSFGMQIQDIGESQAEKQVLCLSDCNFLKIQKRLLAILITSFEIDFQTKNKMWSEININNQIKGQNYCSPQKQLLLKNVQRIRTSERKIRDIKLRYLSSNKIKKQDELGTIQKHQNFKQTMKQPIKIQQEQTNQKQTLTEDRRRMIKTTEGRFRSTTVLKYINTFGGLEEDKKYDAIRKKMGDENFTSNEKVNQIEILAVDIQQPKSTDRLRVTNAFEIRQKLEKQRSTRSNFKFQKDEVSQKFIPKLQVKTKNNMFTIRQDSDIIGVFLDKKIKSQIIKKAEKIMNMNKNAKLAENKNLKRIFATCSSRQLNAISEAQRKSIADDIVQRMTNLKDNPLLLHIQKQRKKQQQQIKLAQKARVSPQLHKKIKREDHMILINNQQQ